MPDCITQYDSYRTSYNEFKIAKNEYDKFHTLTSEATVLEKTKSMLTWRNSLIHSYLVLLGEKSTENPGLTDQDRALYQGLIDNENIFLETQSTLISSISSINNATKASKLLQSHYIILQTSIRQILLGLAAGELNYIYLQYVELVKEARVIPDQSRPYMQLAQQSTADNWIVSINSKQVLYEQKISEVRPGISSLKSNNLSELEKNTAGIKKDIWTRQKHICRTEVRSSGN